MPKKRLHPTRDDDDDFSASEFSEEIESNESSDSFIEDNPSSPPIPKARLIPHSQQIPDDDFLELSDDSDDSIQFKTPARRHSSPKQAKASSSSKKTTTTKRNAKKNETEKSEKSERIQTRSSSKKSVPKRGRKPKYNNISDDSDDVEWDSLIEGSESTIILGDSDSDSDVVAGNNVEWSSEDDEDVAEYQRVASPPQNSKKSSKSKKSRKTRKGKKRGRGKRKPSRARRASRNSSESSDFEDKSASEYDYSENEDDQEDSEEPLDYQDESSELSEIEDYENPSLDPDEPVEQDDLVKSAVARLKRKRERERNPQPKRQSEQEEYRKVLRLNSMEAEKVRQDLHNKQTIRLILAFLPGVDFDDPCFEQFYIHSTTSTTNTIVL